MRMIDADKMLSGLKPVTYDMEHNAVTIADMSNIMRNWVCRQPTIPAPQWISVEERLPDVDKTQSGYEKQYVIAATKNGVRPLIFERACVRDKVVRRWKWVWDRIYDGSPVTHWMPLPTSPKDGGE